MIFKDDKEANKWLDEAVASAKGIRAQFVRDIGINRCYYEGVQWLTQTGGINTGLPPQIQRLWTNYNPDTSKLRVTVNRTTRYVVKAAAGTHPEKLYADVLPSETASSIAELGRAQTLESLLNLSVDSAKYLNAARDANHSRSIAGVAGIGLHIRTGKRNVMMDGQAVEIPTKELGAFEFDPSRLILDPSNKCRDLDDHDYVIYCDVWTKDKLKREYQIELQEKDLRPIGQLASSETTMASFTSGRMYARYLQYSKTPGAIVYQIHCKGETGNFDYMYIVVAGASGDKQWLNLSNPMSPYGGNGLPLALIHGHRRPESPYSIGDVAMMRGGQDMLNMSASLSWRMVQASGGYRILLDKRTVPKGVSDDEMAARFSNQVAGIVPLDMGRREENRMKPETMLAPTPPPTLLEMSREVGEEMREDSFKSAASFGGLKTHVPDASYQAALEQADQVAGIRVGEDVQTHQKLMNTMLCTQIRHVQEGSAGTLAMLTRNGFDQEDFEAILATDANDPAVAISIRESSVRYRSPAQRKADLNTALEAQAVTPIDYRLAMADDLDTPATRTDRTTINSIRKLVMRTVAGQPWVAISLGSPAGQWAIDEMRQEMLNCMKSGNTQAVQLLNKGIMDQVQIDAPPMPMPAAGQGQPAQEEQLPATIGQLYEKMAGSGNAA